jgi:predicted DNA-binding protein YlxM (UPF0122 family)
VKAVNDHPYTPEIVTAILESWPQIESGSKSGVLTIRITPEMKVTTEGKIATEYLMAMVPVASRRTNTTYQIDNVATMVADIDTAIRNTLTHEQFFNLRWHYFWGYTLEEIALRRGVSRAAISQQMKRSIARMAEYLEEPKAPKIEPKLPPRNTIHTRKYDSTYLPI